MSYMKITQDFIQELKRRNPIENIISQEVTLKRTGSNLVGLCPFHNEKTPSFTVFLNEQSYFCFGCENGGDVITYVMNKNNCSYLEAIEFLCKQSGMKMIDISGVDANLSELRQKIYAINRDAARYYNECLYDPKNKEALKYMTDVRKLDKNTITHFGIGYSPSKQNEFKSYMFSQGYSIKDLIDAKLCSENEGNASFFRDRIMFPIIDNSGNVIAFGGRALGDKQPKYLNSTDTPVFKKRNSLFSLNFARKSGKESIILCEGYMDVIGFNIAGLTNSVATLGTALTQEQANLLSHYTKKVVLSYDSDSAGQKAIERAIPILSQADIEVVVLKLTGAKDPDEYVRKFGRDALVKAVNESVGKIRFIMDTTLSKYNLNNSDDKSRAAHELCVIASKQVSIIDRNLVINEISEKISIDKNVIQKEVDRLVKIETKNKLKKEQNNAINKLTGYNDKANPEYAKNVKVARTEEIILGYLMCYPELLEKVRKGEINLKESDFLTSFGKKLFKRLLEEDFISPSSYADSFSNEEISKITKINIDRHEKTDDFEPLFIMNVEILQKDTKTQSFDEILANKKRLREEQKNGT